MEFEILESWKYADVKHRPKSQNVFFVLQNSETKMFYSTKEGSVEELEKATKYTSIGKLKEAIQKVFYPKNKLLLSLLPENNVFTEYKIPADAFDNHIILRVVQKNV